MSRKINYLIIIGAFVIQPFIASLLPALFVPNLLFCILMIMASTMQGEEMVGPMVLIFVLSLIQDIYYNQYVGVTVISLLITMLVVMWIRRLANIENIIFVAMIVIVANLFYSISYWGIYALLSSPYSFLYMLRRLPESAVPNIVVMFIALFIITRDLIQRRRDEYFR